MGKWKQREAMRAYCKIMQPIANLLIGKGGSTMKGWILPYIQRHKGRMVLSVFLGFLGVFSAAMLLFVSGYLISKSALKPENIMIVYVPIYLFVHLVLVKHCFLIWKNSLVMI